MIASSAAGAVAVMIAALVALSMGERRRRSNSDDGPDGRNGGEGAAPNAGERRSLASRLVARTGDAAVQVVLLAVALVWLLPTIGLLASSLRPVALSGSSGWWDALTEPAQLTLDNYEDLLANDQITGSFTNTVLISLPATIAVVVIAALAAYAFAWLDFPGRDLLFLLVVALLVVPLQVGLIPVANLFGELGIYGSLIGVVLFHVAFGLPFAIFLLRNFFAGIPRDLLEAARMDGASERRIFWKVILPLGLPAIGSLAIFQFLWVWNDLLIALVFAEPGNAPLTVALRGQTRQFGSNIDILAPGAFVSLAVPLVVFFAFQRWFTEGLLAGSVK